MRPDGETRDVTVEGTFTATSAAFRQSNRNVFDDGVCVFRDSSRGTSRNAMFSGTVDGQPLELGDPETGSARSCKAPSAPARSVRSKPDAEELATGPRRDEGRGHTGADPVRHDRPREA